jgi:CheY-like chemotaxis protein
MTKTKKILVVDDSVFVCVSMEDTLNAGNYTVEHARSGEEALKMMSDESYDLVYLDMIMPGLDGIETCKLIKELSPDAKLVFMTGCYDDVQARRSEFVSAGGEDYCLFKPFTRDEVLLSAATYLMDR